MKIAVLKFPGSFGSEDLIYSLHSMMNYEVKEIWYEDTSIDAYDCIFLPSGSISDDFIRPGALVKAEKMIALLKKYADRGGYVFGFGNGFQLLCEIGLLPGALLLNESGNFVGKNIYLSLDSAKSMPNSFIDLDEDKPLKLPIAHKYGRYFASDEVLADLRLNHQILYRYCNRFGVISLEYNPDGSCENIAGICNENRNVYGMMPHPDRATDEDLGNTDGKYVLESFIQTVKKSKK